MPLTIDKLDISVYNLYAVRTRMVEQLNQQLHFNEAASIPPQTIVPNTSSFLAELDMLLGVTQTQNPWAYFMPPPNFGAMRRSPFTFAKVLASLSDPAKQEEALLRLNATSCTTKEEEEEKAGIRACLTQIDQINNWLGFIIGRVGQFLQG